MRWLLFLSRLAFISNIFLLLAASMLLINWITQPDIVSTVLIIGFLFSFVVNPGVNLIYFLLLVLRRNPGALVPTWLFVANLVFLAIQILYVFLLKWF